MHGELQERPYSAYPFASIYQPRVTSLTQDQGTSCFTAMLQFIEQGVYSNSYNYSVNYRSDPNGTVSGRGLRLTLVSK